MSQATIQLETLTCPSCLAKIEGALKKLDGVDHDSIEVKFNASRAKLDFDETQISIDTIEDSIRRVGFDVIRSRVK